MSSGIRPALWSDVLELNNEFSLSMLIFLLVFRFQYNWLLTIGSPDFTGTLMLVIMCSLWSGSCSYSLFIFLAVHVEFCSGREIFCILILCLS